MTDYYLYTFLDLPAWASDREVVRATLKRVSPDKKGRDCRTQRHALIRTMVKEHHEARSLYNAVQTGSF